MEILENKSDLRDIASEREMNSVPLLEVRMEEFCLRFRVIPETPYELLEVLLLCLSL